MNLKQLEYFVQVAELGSFSKAAVALDVAQPALSRQVRALETEVRQQLFLRMVILRASFESSYEPLALSYSFLSTSCTRLLYVFSFLGSKFISAC